MSRLTRDGTAEPVSRDQILRHERGQGVINFPCSVDHVHEWQPYSVDPYSCCICCVTYILCMYVCMYGHLVNIILRSREWINRVRLPILLVVS